ncbi:hypothetical protein H0H93_001704 [Arthromyces matolae]|nr:hypothetical protein H0H93_001704 [Arthromyces matolae]
MPLNLADLEAAIRKAFDVTFLEIKDQSSGCGESYSVIIVSEKTFTPAQYEAHLAKGTTS